MPATIPFRANTSITRARLPQYRRPHPHLSSPVVVDYIRQPITVHVLDPNGTVNVDPVLSSTFTMHKVLNNDQWTWLEVKNTDTKEHMVTILTQVANIDGLDVPDRVIQIAGGETVRIPLRPATHNVQTGTDRGSVYVNVDVNSLLSLWAFSIPH